MESDLLDACRQYDVKLILVELQYKQGPARDDLTADADDKTVMRV